MNTRIDRQRAMRLLRRLAICAVAAFALAVVMEWLQVKTEPQAYATVCETEETPQSVDLSMFALVECTYQDGMIVVDGGPAQIDYTFGDPQTMDMVIVNMGKVSGTYIVRTLYAGWDEELSLDHSVQVVTENGQSSAFVELPQGNYNKLAIQIAGDVSVESVEFATNATLSTAPVEESMRFDRIMKVFWILLIALFALTQLGVWKRIICFPGKAWKRIRAFDRHDFIKLLVFIGAGAGGYLFARLLIRHDLGLNINWILNLCCLSVGVCVGSMFCFHKTLGKKPEVFFLIFVLLIGGLMAFFYQDTCGISWDDIYHFQNALHASYIDEGRQTQQDHNSIYQGAYAVYDLEKWDQWHAEQDEAQAEGAVALGRGDLDASVYWSYTQGFGLYLGRVLGLPYWFIWSLGRFCGLLAYAIIGYYAIRRLKSGKMILASILLIPEAVFLASQYSYDPAVTAFMGLGMAYFVAEWQEADSPMTWGNALIMIGAIYVGCLVKGIYFPVLLMPLFLSKKKFVSVRHRRAFFVLIFSAILALIVRFVIPFFGGGGVSDTRGGDDVNAFSQIAFIFNNPLTYTDILLSYLRHYLDPNEAPGLLGFFAYKDKILDSYIYFALLAVVTFTDRNEYDIALSDSKWIRLLYQVLLFGVVCMMITALYIIFTPVGYYTVNGCQQRYLLPLLFPVMMMLGTGRITNKSNREVYNGVLFSVIGFVSFSGVVIRCLALYHVG